MGKCAHCSQEFLEWNGSGPRRADAAPWLVPTWQSRSVSARGADAGGCRGAHLWRPHQVREVQGQEAPEGSAPLAVNAAPRVAHAGVARRSGGSHRDLSRFSVKRALLDCPVPPSLCAQLINTGSIFIILHTKWRTAEWEAYGRLVNLIQAHVWLETTTKTKTKLPRLAGQRRQKRQARSFKAVFLLVSGFCKQSLKSFENRVF